MMGLCLLLRRRLLLLLLSNYSLCLPDDNKEGYLKQQVNLLNLAIAPIKLIQVQTAKDRINLICPYKMSPLEIHLDLYHYQVAHSTAKLKE